MGVTCRSLELSRFLQDQLPPDGHVIDVGAHVGMLTVPMARAVAPLGRVDALEPVPRNAEALRRTIVANSLEATAQVLEAAADATTGVARICSRHQWTARNVDRRGASAQGHDRSRYGVP